MKGIEMSRTWVMSGVLGALLLTSGCNIMPRAKQEDVLQVRRLLVQCTPVGEFTDVFVGITAFGNAKSTRPMPADLCATRMLPAFVAALRAEHPDVEAVIETPESDPKDFDAMVRLSVGATSFDFAGSSSVPLGDAGVYERNSPLGDRTVVYGSYLASLALLKITPTRDRPHLRNDVIKCVKRIGWDDFEGDFSAVRPEQWAEADATFLAMTEAAMTDLARSIYSKFEPSLLTEHRNCGGWT